MQLNVDNYIRGIRCDLSGEEVFDKFTYYSITGQPFYVDQGKHLINPGPKDSLDLDVCKTAFDNLWGRVRENLSDAKKDCIKCDLSPRYMNGKFTYWKLNIQEVVVEIKQVDSPDKMDASVVSKDSWELNVCDEEVQAFLKLQEKHCAEPFDENSAPKVTTKRDVLRIPAPSSEPTEVEAPPEIQEATPDIPEPTPDIQEVEKPNIGHVIENNPAFFKSRVEEIISKSKKPHPASPDTPDVEFEPEVTKKTELPDVGARVNIKKRKKKK